MHLHAENFLSFRTLDLDLEGAGLTLVEGENCDDDSAQSNGSGKSAIVDALLWCLFGVTLRGYESDDVVHRKVGKDCVVSVQVVPDDRSVMYEVKRARRHAKLKNALLVEETNHGGETSDISRASIAETQELVEDLLGCSLKTFVTSVVFGQDRAYRFSSLTDREQKEILDEVLGVGRFAEACTSAREMKTTHDANTDRLIADHVSAEEDRVAAEEEAAGLREKDSTFEEERDAETALVIKTRDSTNAKLAKIGEVDVEASKRKVRKAKDDEDAARAALAEAQRVVSDAQAKFNAAEEAHEQIGTQIDEVTALGGSCPTCRQDVEKKHHKRVLADLRTKESDAEAKKGKLDKVVNGAMEVHGVMSKAADAARAAVRLAEAKLDVALKADAEARVLRADAKRCRERLAELKEKENPYKALAERVEKKAASYRKAAAEFAEKLTAEEAKLKSASFWVDAFGARGLRSLLLDGSLPILNEEAARVSNAVTGGAIDVEFSATSDLKSGKTVDRFEVKVDNKHGAPSYKGNSAGERAKVDLCVGLALQKLVASRASASFNVVFMDEIFDHLDAAAHERVVEVLAELDKESVFVISHNEDLKAWFPNTLRVVKRGGYSEVER